MAEVIGLSVSPRPVGHLVVAFLLYFTPGEEEVQTEQQRYDSDGNGNPLDRRHEVKSKGANNLSG